MESEVLAVEEDPDRAWEALDRMAAELRRQRATRRYGLRLEHPYPNVWWVVLVDRE